jgi:hypothetical protein
MRTSFNLALASLLICLASAGVWDVDSLTLNATVDPAADIEPSPSSAISLDGTYGFFIAGSSLLRVDLSSFSLAGYEIVRFFYGTLFDIRIVTLLSQTVP